MNTVRIYGNDVYLVLDPMPSVCVPLHLGKLKPKNGLWIAKSVGGRVFKNLPSQKAAIEALRTEWERLQEQWASEAAGLGPLVVPEGAALTKAQLTHANAESIRLRFNRNLKNAEGLPDYKFPVVAAFHAGSYVRLAIFIATNADGWGGEPHTLDVSPDFMAEMGWRIVRA
jgi:hypothetical protein